MNLQVVRASIQGWSFALCAGFLMAAAAPAEAAVSKCVKKEWAHVDVARAKVTRAVAWRERPTTPKMNG